MLVDIIQCYSREMSMLESDWVATTIKDLIRHGAMVLGAPTIQSSSVLPPDMQYFREQLILSTVYLPLLLADCARLDHELFTKLFVARGPIRVLYGVEGGQKSHIFGIPYFWAVLSVIQSLDSPVIRQLFNCGALPHVKSLENVPFSAQDRQLHDGPTCQCDGVELSVEQRKIPISALLTTPRVVPSLQASCRTIIINSTQSHGVKQLPLPPMMIGYLLQLHDCYGMDP